MPPEIAASLPKSQLQVAVLRLPLYQSP
ncbi:hypothetical protein A2U01_0109881 [Trifolium medium]|uniref:Uncharacterized protein n=1 Tax=Trifolium medium TaxID=97028 RepID=A0A392VJM7_9FABA|nr:hypothetical protein [Trifolium medium]